MAETKTKDWKKSANTRRTRSLIAGGLADLFAVHDDIPVAQHLVSILRSKGKQVGTKPDGTPVYRDPYNIKDDEFLKDLEAHAEGLNQMKTGEEED